MAWWVKAVDVLSRVVPVARRAAKLARAIKERRRNKVDPLNADWGPTPEEIERQRKREN